MGCPAFCSGAIAWTEEEETVTEELFSYFTKCLPGAGSLQSGIVLRSKVEFYQGRARILPAWKTGHARARQVKITVSVPEDALAESLENSLKADNSNQGWLCRQSGGGVEGDPG